MLLVFASGLRKGKGWDMKQWQQMILPNPMVGGRHGKGGQNWNNPTKFS